MSGSEKTLLFCDTFSHEGEEGELHVDLVKFCPQAVVQEVRIVPPNIRAHSSTRELDRHGLTQPSSFNLDVYVNDSSNPLAPTFEHIGVIEYQPGTISLQCNPKNSSDQVVLKGLYTTLTVSIYGTLSSSTYGQSPSPHKRSVSPYSNSESELSDNDKRRVLTEGGDGKTFELFEPFSPVNSPDHLFELSDEDIMPSKRTNAASGGYEELSDDEVSFDGDFDAQEGVDSYYGEEGWLTSGVGFNPYQCVLGKLEYFQLVTNTPHEVLLERLRRSDAGSKRGGSDEASKLRDVILKKKEQYPAYKWVEMLEEIPSFLYPGLAQLENRSSADGKEVMQRMVHWTLQCMDLEAARQLPMAVNVRFLKAGLRLVPGIASLGRKCANALIKHSVMETLCHLLTAERMATTLKLLVLRAIDSLLDYPQGMERFFGWNNLVNSVKIKQTTPYQKILELLLTQPTPRVCCSVAALLKKASVAKFSGELQEIVDRIIQMTPVKLVRPPTPIGGDLYDLYADMEMGGVVEDGNTRVRMNRVGPADGVAEGDMTRDHSSEEDKNDRLKDPGGDAESEGEEHLETDDGIEQDVMVGPGGVEDYKGIGTRLDKEGEGLIGDRMGLAGKEEGLARVESDQVEEKVEEESEEKVPPFVLSEGEVKTVVRCLEDLRLVLEQARHTTVQPPTKCFPTCVRTYPIIEEEDFFNPLARSMLARRLPDCLLVLLTAPSTSMELGIFAAVRDLLLFFLSTQEGLVFLLSKPLVISAMIRTLTQAMDDSMLPLTAFLHHGEENCLVSCTAHNLGLLLNYHLQALLSLDTLRRASKLNMSELESAECIGALHTLYSMALAPIGKCAVSYILALSDNVLTLLPFIEPRHLREHDIKLTKSSVSSRYVAILIIQLLKSSVRFDFLFSHGSQLLSAAEFFKDNSSPLMSDLYNWLSPVKELTNSDSSKVIQALVNLIREKAPAVSCNKPGKAGFPILTAIRLLLCFVIPPPNTKGAQKQTKWGLSLLHLISANTLDTLLFLLNKFYDALLPVWSQRQSLSVSHASTLVSLATFALQLLRELLASLLEGGDFQLRDIRVASTLLKLHVVLCSAPYSTVATNAAHEVQLLIVGILAMYTKPQDILQEGDEQPDLSKNCWCLMLKEVFEHTLSSPQSFLSGLMVLSELLPLPLPTPTIQPVSGGKQRLSFKRKVWVLHLEPFISSILEMVQMFLVSSASALQQMLRRVCAQLADISASFATLITRQIIFNTLVEIEKQLEREEPEVMETTSGSREEERTQGEGDGGCDKEEQGEHDTETMEQLGEQKVPNSRLLRHLSMCSALCQQPAFKIALLHLISQKETADTKGFSRFIPLLLFLVQKKETAVHLKLCIMSVLNALCNIYVALNTNELEDSPLTDQQLSDCLPGRTKLEHITSAILSHVTSPDQPLATMMLGLKVLLSLCQYDAGLLNVYRLLPTHVNGFSFILERLTKAISPGTPSADTISCISLFLQLLGHLLSSEVTGREELASRFSQSKLRAGKEELEEGEEDEEEEEEGEDVSSSGSEKKGRRESHHEVRSVGFPRPLLKMIVCSENGDLLGKLRHALEVNCKEDVSLLAGFAKIIATLEQEFKTVKPRLPELAPLEHSIWPPMQSVEIQFELRNVFSRSLNPPSPDFWMTTPPNDESELEPDLVTRDLKKLATQNCPGLNLEEELKKRLLPSPPHTPPHTDRKRKIALSGPEAQKRLREAIHQRMMQGPKRDMFRLRKQNTSRPPSMHVDDFMAKSGASRGGRGLRDHLEGIASDGGRGGAFPYIPPHPGMFLPQLGLGGRWPGTTMHPSLGYTRRDLTGLGNSMRLPWNTRGIPPAFLSATQPAAALRNASMYSALQAYSRHSNSGRGPVLWPSSAKSSTSSRLGDGGSHKSSGSSRHSVYKRLV